MLSQSLVSVSKCYLCGAAVWYPSSMCLYVNNFLCATCVYTDSDLHNALMGSSAGQLEVVHDPLPELVPQPSGYCGSLSAHTEL